MDADGFTIVRARRPGRQAELPPAQMLSDDDTPDNIAQKMRQAMCDGMRTKFTGGKLQIIASSKQP